MSNLKVLPNNLPCFPCPHDAVCCSWGTDLTEKEAKDIFRLYGGEALRLDGNNWRTSLKDGKCFFLDKSACSIHDTPHYPSTCRGFPWHNGDSVDEPYEGDLTICPELK